MTRYVEITGRYTVDLTEVESDALHKMASECGITLSEAFGEMPELWAVEFADNAFYDFDVETEIDTEQNDG